MAKGGSLAPPAAVERSEHLASILPRGAAEALPESPAEVRQVVESPVKRDLGQTLAGVGRIRQVLAAVLQPAAPDVAHQRSPLVSKKIVDVAGRQAYASGDHRGIQAWLGKMPPDERLDPVEGE